MIGAALDMAARRIIPLWLATARVESMRADDGNIITVGGWVDDNAGILRMPQGEGSAIHASVLAYRGRVRARDAARTAIEKTRVTRGRV